VRVSGWLFRCPAKRKKYSLSLKSKLRMSLVISRNN